jgi:hypothetical protein
MQKQRKAAECDSAVAILIELGRRRVQRFLLQVADGRAAILVVARPGGRYLAGFVSGLPTASFAVSQGVQHSLLVGAPDADVRSGPVCRFPWRSSPGAVDFLPGLASDLQRVAILFPSRAGGCVGGNMLFRLLSPCSSRG